ncbi:MAG TPA: protein kinase [Actinomycetes bacterium]|nr:protein kinase [Actinomycetes bacterium]
MRAGDVINGYTILEDFRVVGAGLSKWTFAAKNGREYFIKEFLSPTYPDEHAPGSAQTKMRKRRRCAAFERHHRRIQEALAAVSGLGGNLIVTLDFFRWGAKYYKVTEKVEVAGLEPGDVAALTFQDQLVLLKTVAHSLRILHDRGIVHGDLKPSNVLIKRTELGYTTKLIDFDNAYLAGEPPPPEEIVGTMNYYSPELVGYIQETGTTGAELTQKADIFALGLIYTEYLTGAPPPFDAATHQYAGVAVRAGETLRLPPTTLPAPVVELVERMLLGDPAARPSIAETHITLMGIRTPATTTTAVLAEPPPAAASTDPTRLKGRGLRAATGRASAPAPERRPTRRLVGKLLERRKDTGAP